MHRNHLLRIVERKNRLDALDKRGAALDDEQEAITEDQTRIRENLAKLGNSREEVELRQRYVRKLAGQEDRLKEILAEAESLDRSRVEGKKELDDYLQALVHERKL
jgi:pyruvate-formate lyase-activating enzyme